MTGTARVARTRRWRTWAGQHRVLYAVLAVAAALCSIVPISFLALSMSRSNFPGYSSPIFFVPLAMLVLFGVGFLFCVVSLLASRRP